MRADRQRSGSVGGSLAEVQAYVDIVMGRKTMYARGPCTLEALNTSVHQLSDLLQANFKLLQRGLLQYHLSSASLGLVTLLA